MRGSPRGLCVLVAPGSQAGHARQWDKFHVVSLLLELGDVRPPDIARRVLSGLVYQMRSVRLS